MIDVSIIKNLVEQKFEGTDMFLVEINSNPASEIEVIVDSDTVIGIDTCAELSKIITAEFDRDIEDFELTVCSAGVGYPLKTLRQYQKLISSEVEVVLKEGSKIVGTLTAVTQNSITVAYKEKVAVEGKKRKELVDTVREYALDDVKSTRQHLVFK